MNELEIVNREPGALPMARTSGDRMDQIIATIIEAPNAIEKVEVLERILALRSSERSSDAEMAFNSAFAKLQSELPVIVAKTVIPNRGKYEKFEDVMHAVGPHLSANGFSVSFTQDQKDNRTVVTCTLRHVNGHKETNSYGVRAGGKADSDTQADCKASTTAKRQALLQALNIVIRQDCLNEENDASLEGDPTDFVTTSQAAALEHRAKILNADIPAMLRFSGAKSFVTIPAHRYDELDSLLTRKEQKGR